MHSPSLEEYDEGARRLRETLARCRENWPDCVEGGHHPSCCRFPKECSAPTWVDRVRPTPTPVGYTDPMPDQYAPSPVTTLTLTVECRSPEVARRIRQGYWPSLDALQQEVGVRAVVSEMRVEDAMPIYPPTRPILLGDLMDEGARWTENDPEPLQ